MSIREKYNIPHEAKVLLYVGNISENKNQVQMVRAYGLLPEILRKTTWVLFCGADHEKNGVLEGLISATPYGEHLVLCGGVDKNDMPCYYQEANGVVLLSVAEGFGLSLIEGMHFGLPCAMPADLDAFDDLFDEKAVVAINSREDDAVAKSIEELLSKRWDNCNIKNYSSKFCGQIMAESYINVYRKEMKGKFDN